MKFKKLMAYVLSASIILSAGSVGTNVSAAQNPSGKDHKIYLKAATLEPGKGSLSTKSTKASFRVFSNEEKPYIISFDGPITDETKNSLMEMGVTFLDYTPEYSYLCFMTSDTAEKSKGVSHVVDVFTYENEYKIDPALMSKISENRGKKSAKGIDVPNLELEVRISTFGIDDSNLTREIEDLGAFNVYQNGKDIYAKALPNIVEKLSALKAVKFIEEVPEFKINNNRAHGIVQSELASTFGYEGEGQIVGVADSGLDKGISGLNNGTIHRDFIGRVNTIIDRIGSSGKDENGHGTHVAGSIVGNGVMSQGKIKGMAPEAKLFVQKIGTADGIVSPGSLEELFQEAYDNGVRIHSDSWGSAGIGSYDSWSADLDNFVWSHKDMLIVVAAGNEGPDNCTVGSPGTAKNCLTVGATENFRPFMKLRDGSSMSDDPSEVAFFSSRGCEDGRIKPDVVAPGSYIASTMSSSILPEFLKYSSTYPGYPNYEYMSGTSMATPITSGSVAVIRECIVKNYNINPSSALLKAFVINGALDPNGYSEDKGWGKVSLYDSMFGTQIINDTDSVSEGQQQSYTISCTRSNRPLKISLVWSDYPASAQNAASLVNDLDLIVTAPDGSVTYYGNDFTIPYDSAFDRTNNVENIIINNPVEGEYTIEVLGHSVPQGPQPFALVGSSDFLSTPKSIKATATTDSITINWDHVPGAVGYDVEVDGMNIVNVSGTSYTHSNLAYNSEHEYRIRAKDTRTYSVWSSTFTHSSQLDTPVLNNTWADDGIQLTWDPVPQATSYEIYMDNNYITSTDSNIYTIKDLIPESNYEFFIRARTDFNSSDSSNILEITIPDVGVSYSSPMTTERMNFGAAASSNGKIYVAGGKNGSVYLNTVEEYDPSNGTWAQKAPMSQARSGVRLVEANNGKIYAIGGFNGNSYLNTVEEYDPASNSWTVKTGMNTSRSDFGIACVGGRIYVIGGYNGATLRSVESYDPNTDTWTNVADMPTARSNFGTGVVNGKITVMGGICGTDNLKAVEEFDPSSGKWTIKNNLSDWNSDFSVSEANGKLYILGGKNSTQITEYVPLTCSEVEAVELPSMVYGHASVVQNGNIYVLGGLVDSSCSNQNLRYIPQKDGWIKESPMLSERSFFTAEIVNGKIYIFGGEDKDISPVKTVEEYDISTGTWSSCPPMSESKTYLASGVIEGKIYVCGGDYWNYNLPYSNVLEVFDPVSKTWTRKANMPTGLSMPKAVSLNGCLYVVGGHKLVGSNIEFSQSVYKYDPTSNSWSTVASLPVPRVNHGLVTVNGKIYAIGGNNSTGVLDSIYEYDPLTDTWTAKDPVPQANFQFSTAVINDKIYIIGGSDSAEDLSSVYEYDPSDETWTEKQSLPSVMARNCSVFDGNKIYTMGGMLDRIINIDVIDTVYSYSPSDESIIRLDMGSGLMEPKAGTNTLPLSISNVPSNGIYEVDITLEYDPSTLSITGITPGSAIADTNAFYHNVNETFGIVNISYFGTQQTISSDGILANIEFNVLDSVTTAQSSTLSFIKGVCNVYGENSCEYKGAELIDGAVDIFIYGDVDGNGTCNSIDFASMNKYLLGQIKNLPGAYSAISGDLNASGNIDSLDFAVFRLYMLGNISKFPAQVE
jgi:N-acetylneuraminic acid mutarotase/subtilisin family serine protease